MKIIVLDSSRVMIDSWNIEYLSCSGDSWTRVYTLQTRKKTPETRYLPSLIWVEYNDMNWRNKRRGIERTMTEQPE